MRPDYYSILQISKTASVEEIKAAFRKLAMRFHPDKNPGAEDQFRKILEAYDVLIDPDKRRKYDAGSFYFDQYRKHAPQKTAKNKQKDYSFTDEQYRERQEFAKRYREQYKKKQQEEAASLPSYSDFKYIMISIPLAVALLFFVINSWNGDERKTVTPKVAVKPAEKNSGSAEQKLQQVIKDSLNEKEQRAMANMYISPWNKVIGAPLFDTSSAKVLRIENRSGADAMVCLYDEQKKKFIRNNYVADGYYLLMEYLPAGKYHLRVVYGKDWNTANQTTDFNYEGMFDSVLVYAKFNSQHDKIIVQGEALKKSDTIVRELPVITKVKTASRINNHEFFWR